MLLTALPTIALFIAVPASAPPDAAALDHVRAAIAAAVQERLGAESAIDVELLAPVESALRPPLVATVPSGARSGQPARFLLTPAGGRPFTVLARATATVGHAVATRALTRDVALTAA